MLSRSHARVLRQFLIRKQSTAHGDLSSLPIVRVHLRNAPLPRSAVPFYSVIQEIESLYGAVQWFRIAPMLHYAAFNYLLFISFRDAETSKLIPHEGRTHKLSLPRHAFASSANTSLQDFAQLVTKKSSPLTFFGPYSEHTPEERAKILQSLDSLPQASFPDSEPVDAPAETQSPEPSVSFSFALTRQESLKLRTPFIPPMSFGAPFQRTVARNIAEWGGFASEVTPSTSSNPYHLMDISETSHDLVHSLGEDTTDHRRIRARHTTSNSPKPPPSLTGHVPTPDPILDFLHDIQDVPRKNNAPRVDHDAAPRQADFDVSREAPEALPPLQTKRVLNTKQEPVKPSQADISQKSHSNVTPTPMPLKSTPASASRVEIKSTPSMSQQKNPGGDVSNTNQVPHQKSPLPPAPLKKAPTIPRVETQSTAPEETSKKEQAKSSPTPSAKLSTPLASALAGKQEKSKSTSQSPPSSSAKPKASPPPLNQPVAKKQPSPASSPKKQQSATSQVTKPVVEQRKAKTQSTPNKQNQPTAKSPTKPIGSVPSNSPLKQKNPTTPVTKAKATKEPLAAGKPKNPPSTTKTKGNGKEEVADKDGNAPLPPLSRLKALFGIS